MSVIDINYAMETTSKYINLVEQFNEVAFTFNGTIAYMIASLRHCLFMFIYVHYLFVYQFIFEWN